MPRIDSSSAKNVEGEITALTVSNTTTTKRIGRADQSGPNSPATVGSRIPKRPLNVDEPGAVGSGVGLNSASNPHESLPDKENGPQGPKRRPAANGSRSQSHKQGGLVSDNRRMPPSEIDKMNQLYNNSPVQGGLRQYGRDAFCEKSIALKNSYGFTKGQTQPNGNRSNIRTRLGPNGSLMRTAGRSSDKPTVATSNLRSSGYNPVVDELTPKRAHLSKPRAPFNSKTAARCLTSRHNSGQNASDEDDFVAAPARSLNAETLLSSSSREETKKVLPWMSGDSKSRPREQRNRLMSTTSTTGNMVETSANSSLQPLACSPSISRLSGVWSRSPVGSHAHGTRSQVHDSSSIENDEAQSKGLSNIGNTCYMNVTLQALFCLQQFVGRLAETHHQLSVHLPKPSLLAALVDLIKNREKQTSGERRDQLYQFKNVVSANKTLFTGFEQHDTQEFLSFVLNQLQEEVISARKCKDSKTIVSGTTVKYEALSDQNNNSAEVGTSASGMSSSTETVKDEVMSTAITVKEEPSSPCAELVVTANQSHSPANTLDPIGEFFSFQLQRRFECDACSVVSTRLEDHLDFGVSIPNKLRQEALDAGTFVKFGQMLQVCFGAEKFDRRCESCKKEMSTVTDTFHTLPKILVIHVKRSYFDQRSERVRKTTVKIEIPPKLDLAEYFNKHHMEFDASLFNIVAEEDQKPVDLYSPTPKNSPRSAVIKNEDDVKKEDDILDTLSSDAISVSGQHVKKSQSTDIVPDSLEHQQQVPCFTDDESSQSDAPIESTIARCSVVDRILRDIVDHVGNHVDSGDVVHNDPDHENTDDDDTSWLHTPTACRSTNELDRSGSGSGHHLNVTPTHTKSRHLTSTCRQSVNRSMAASTSASETSVCDTQTSPSISGAAARTPSVLSIRTHETILSNSDLFTSDNSQSPTITSFEYDGDKTPQAHPLVSYSLTPGSANSMTTCERPRSRPVYMAKKLPAGTSAHSDRGERGWESIRTSSGTSCQMSLPIGRSTGTNYTNHTYDDDRALGSPATKRCRSAFAGSEPQNPTRRLIDVLTDEANQQQTPPQIDEQENVKSELLPDGFKVEDTAKDEDMEEVMRRIEQQEQEEKIKREQEEEEELQKVMAQIEAMTENENKYPRLDETTEEGGDGPQLAEAAEPSDDVQYEYQLAAVLSHIGSSSTSGHYVCDVRQGNSASAEWLSCDDSRVTAISQQQVCARRQASAYVLVYINTPVLHCQTKHNGVGDDGQSNIDSRTTDAENMKLEP